MNSKKTAIVSTVIAALLIVGIIFYPDLTGMGESVPEGRQVVMYKNPGCQCCTYWAEHMERNGYSVKEEPVQNLNAYKTKYGLPRDVSACHTAVVDGYVVEGHVPVREVNRLLEERPEAIGIGVPGMPAGSPGMAGLNPESYDVYLIGNTGEKSVYASY